MCSLFASFINCTICSSFSALTTTSGICENCFPPSSYAYDSIFSASVRTFFSPKIVPNSFRISGVTLLYSMSTSSFTAGCFAFREFLDQDRQDLEDVSDDPEVTHSEDPGVRVIVDGHDDLSRTHSCKVLDCTGDAKGNVEAGTHGLAGETHLMGVGDPAHVDRLPGSSYRAIEQVCKFMEQVEVLGILHPFATGDDHVRLLNGERGRFLFDELDELHLGDIEVIGVLLDDNLACSRCIESKRLFGSGAYGRHLRPVLRRLDGGHDIAADRRTRLNEEAALLFDVEHSAICGQPGLYPGSQDRHDRSAVRRC